MKEIKTPLQLLAQILCSDSDTTLFPNQAIMYQTIVLFSSNKLNAAYGFSTTDELIPQVQHFIYRTAFPSDDTDFQSLHQCIYSNIVGFPCERSLPMHHVSNRFKFPYSQMTTLKSNINRTINGFRHLPLAWCNEWNRNGNNIGNIIYRLFWILQYYLVYYANDKVDKNYSFDATSHYVEFFSLNYEIGNTLLRNLKTHFTQYSCILLESNDASISLYTLSRIIIDILATHANNTYVPLHPSFKKLSRYNSKNKLSNLEQSQQFEKYVACYGQHTIDRFHVLELYAPYNYLAALELGQLYFYGEDLICGRSNYYTLAPCYTKAMQCFQTAYALTNPPSPIACWWIGYMYKEGYGTIHSNLDIAQKYFSLAGDFPPAYNDIGLIKLSYAELEYINYKRIHNDVPFEEILHNFIIALEYLDKAAKNSWFYGYNNIARFLYKYRNETYLIAELSKRICLSVPFNFEAQALAAAKLNNPWILTQLAIYYLQNDDLRTAYKYTMKAFGMNYNRAIFIHALRFSSETTKKCNLGRASALNYPKASYQLALIYYVERDYELAEHYITRAEEQNFSYLKPDMKLYKCIKMLKILIRI